MTARCVRRTYVGQSPSVLCTENAALQRFHVSYLSIFDSIQRRQPDCWEAFRWGMWYVMIWSEYSVNKFIHYISYIYHIILLCVSCYLLHGYQIRSLLHSSLLISMVMILRCLIMLPLNYQDPNTAHINIDTYFDSEQTYLTPEPILPYTKYILTFAVEMHSHCNIRRIFVLNSLLFGKCEWCLSIFEG